MVLFVFSSAPCGAATNTFQRLFDFFYGTLLVSSVQLPMSFQFEEASSVQLIGYGAKAKAVGVAPFLHRVPGAGAHCG
jgi:hypothetical protein